ncbi:hypothetical protein T261_0733 [Streptomyces lydicus]|nr:hypothetical protein T261_0733 [Streptomyces lydicus]
MHTTEAPPTTAGSFGRPITPATWDAWAAEGRVSHLVTDRELDFFLRHITDRHGRTAVDAGCGIGKFSRQLRAFGYNVTGVDFSKVSLSVARRSGHGLGLTYLHHDLDAGAPPGLPVRGIDLVVAREVIPFLADPQEWLHQVRTHWLRPGGRLYLVVPVGNERTLQHGQMTTSDIARLREGWGSVAQSDRGPLACLILRSHTQ